MRWLAVVLALCSAAAGQVVGTVSTCVRGEQRPVQGMEVHLFRGESARVVRDAIVAMEQVDADDEAYRRGYDRLRQLVREQRGAKARTDGKGRFKFAERGELVVAIKVRRKQPEFDFAFVSDATVELWVGEKCPGVAGEQRKSKL
jgi:hypothetical protein